MVISKYMSGMSKWWMDRSRMTKFGMVAGGSYLGILGASRFLRSVISPVDRNEPPHQYEDIYRDIRHTAPNTTDFGSPMNHQSAIDRGNIFMRSRPMHTLPQTAGRVQYMHREAIGHTIHGAARNRRYMRELYNI